MSVRVECSAEGCPRYRTHEDPHEGTYWVWLCRDHWRRVPAEHRREMAVIKRRQGKARRHGREEIERRLNRAWTFKWDQAVVMATEFPPAEIMELIG